MKKFVKQLKNERGLTLVELLAVIVILAIVGTIAFVSVGNVMDNSRKDAMISSAQQAISAAKLDQATGDIDSNEDSVSTNSLSLEQIYDPWDDEPIEGTVSWTGDTMEDYVYSIELSALEPNNCTIDATEQQLITEDRDDLCAGAITTGG